MATRFEGVMSYGARLRTGGGLVRKTSVWGPLSFIVVNDKP